MILFWLFYASLGFSCDINKSQLSPDGFSITLSTIDGSKSICDDAPLILHQQKEFFLKIDARDSSKLTQINKIQVAAVMPDHGHGLEKKPLVKKIKPGFFKISPLDFFMDGRWNLEVSFKIDKKTVETTLPLEISSKSNTSELSNKNLGKSKQGLIDFGNVGNFSLLDQSGLPFNSNSLKGKVWIIDFIFTTCKSICPFMTQKMRKLQVEFKNPDKLAFVSVSVDPNHDTPAVLKSYMAKFSVDSTNWTFLTGTQTQINSVARDIFKVPSGSDPNLHSGHFILVDRMQKIRGYFDSNIASEVDDLKDQVKKLLN